MTHPTSPNPDPTPSPARGASATRPIGFSPCITVALSRSADTSVAVAEAVAIASKSLAGRAVDLAVVFFSAHHVARADLIARSIRSACTPRTLLGASAVGILGDDVELENSPGLSILLAHLPDVRLAAFDEDDLDWPQNQDDPAALRAAISEDPQLRGVLLIADPFTPIIRLLPALSKAFEGSPDRPAVPIFGGIASAARRPGDNRLIINDTIRTTGIVGLSISGRIRIDTLVSQGCRPIGTPLVVTSARHNVIEKLGGHPAMDAFQEMATSLGPAERALLENGVFVGRVVDEYRDRFGRGDFLIRNVIGVDRDHGFLAVSDFFRVGQTIQFHVRDARTATEDLELLLAAQQLDDPPLGALLFTCNGRGTSLFGTPHHDVGLIRKSWPTLPLAGFFAAGEIGPVGSATFLHGHTASLALFRNA